MWAPCARLEVAINEVERVDVAEPKENLSHVEARMLWSERTARLLECEEVSSTNVLHGEVGKVAPHERGVETDNERVWQRTQYLESLPLMQCPVEYNWVLHPIQPVGFDRNKVSTSIRQQDM